ncbi:uncharacterized protein [Malus domestica]|uniref:uncharacterized protein isoform X2 n=1 Tax=Malus domestica TaxID=3750 RepID=UPI0010AB223D|nr:uncharacterized protein LOC103427659 isoform X2 [Malus domestica]
MAASRQYKALNSKSDVSGDEKSLYVSLSLDNSFESDVMKHSRALLLLSSDFGTAWHSRLPYVFESTADQEKNPGQSYKE